MSFETLQPPAKAAGNADPVRVSVTARGRLAPSRLAIMVRAEILDQIDKKKKRQFHVLLGKGEDKHLVRLVADEAGVFAAREIKVGRKSTGGIFKISLPAHERWPACTVKARAASYAQAGKDGLDITLPAWAWDTGAKADIEKRAAALGGKA